MKIERRAFLVGSSAMSLLALQGCGGVGKGVVVVPGPTPTPSPSPSPTPSPSPSPSPTPAPPDVYARTLHMVYARSGARAFGTKYSEDKIIELFNQVPGGLTAIVPFLLNVPDATVYDSIIRRVQAQGTIIVPGVGRDPDNSQLNVPGYKNMMANYKQYTDYIRLENTQGYYDAHGAQPIQEMIDLAVQLGYKHIMLNPWPRKAGGGVVEFKNPELDVTIYQVSLKKQNGFPDPSASATNFKLPQGVKIQEMRTYRPSIRILINYESEPQHEVLTNIEKRTPGASILAMDITAREIENSPIPLEWNPPFTTAYDPVALGTWDWLAARIGTFS